MATLNENTQDIVDNVNVIVQQCSDILESIDDIDYGDNSKTLYDIVYENLDTKGNTQLKILLEYIKEYKNTGSIADFIKFLVCFLNNPYTYMEFDDKVRNYIYNKLFNK